MTNYFGSLIEITSLLKKNAFLVRSENKKRKAHRRKATVAIKSSIVVRILLGAILPVI